MIKKIVLILIIIKSLSVYAQPNNDSGDLRIKSGTAKVTKDAKLRESDSPISNVICVISANQFVNVISFELDYYKVEYNGKIGYLNEMYFEEIKNSPTEQVASNNAINTSGNWTESAIKQDFLSRGAEYIEGIYDNSISTNNKHSKHKYAVKKIADKYCLIFLFGEKKIQSWKEGEIVAHIENTATSLLYRATWIQYEKSDYNDFYLSFEDNVMNILIPDKEKDVYLKLYPTFHSSYSEDNKPFKDNSTSPSNTRASGTGFALTSSGIIVTNYHVVAGAKIINIRGVNGDFDKVYSAKLLISDKNNDLAIVQINDQNFSNNIGVIPYTIKPIASNVGESIFVLGYPLRAKMGDEIKLTNGIISSKTGFQGDVTSYQISAPVQPGNSGGPLFNSKGDLIGIINAKLGGAENVSYAVKVSYLLNLMDLLDSKPTLQNTSLVSGKPLTQQVAAINKFVYMIEVD